MLDFVEMMDLFHAGMHGKYQISACGTILYFLRSGAEHVAPMESFGGQDTESGREAAGQIASFWKEGEI